jgi:hypothetical protein
MMVLVLGPCTDCACGWYGVYRWSVQLDSVLVCVLACTACAGVLHELYCWCGRLVVLPGSDVNEQLASDFKRQHAVSKPYQIHEPGLPFTNISYLDWG